MATMLHILQSIYAAIGVSNTANYGDVFGLISILLILIAGFYTLTRKYPVSKISKVDTSVEAPPISKDLEVEKREESIEQDKVEPIEEIAKKEVVQEGPSWAERLKKGFSRSRSEVWGKLENIFSSGSLNEDTIEEMEEILYSADLGADTVSILVDELRAAGKKENFSLNDFKKFLYDFLRQKMITVQEDIDTSLYQFNSEEKGKTKVIMVVGVNGAGKTTTIGKLATKLTREGASVVVGACDTFRAAAVDQLQVWCDRAGAKMIRAKEGSNPSGVGYQALEVALSEKADYCILDTAGRLHTKGNLMDELSKSKSVLSKLDEDAPHEVLLVIDAITGQNALRQAEEFNKALKLTGLIFTKCDGSSKAGSAIGIVQRLNIPIGLIGVGEGVEDLNVFNLDEYLNTLLDIEPTTLN